MKFLVLAFITSQHLEILCILISENDQSYIPLYRRIFVDIFCLGLGEILF